MGLIGKGFYVIIRLMTKVLSAVLVAAGVGERYGGNKLLDTIADTPVIIHSIRAFLLPEITEIIVVSHSQWRQQYQKLIDEFCPDSRIKIIEGGAQRWQSSLLGIRTASGELVAIHDAARPLISAEHIRQSYNLAAAHGAALVAAPATDSIKVVHDQQNTAAIDRNTIYLAQTPQTFQRELILRAFTRAREAGFDKMTDESELVTRFLERPVAIVTGNNRNLKITYPQDLLVARALYQE